VSAQQRCIAAMRTPLRPVIRRNSARATFHAYARLRPPRCAPRYGDKHATFPPFTARSPLCRAARRALFRLFSVHIPCPALFLFLPRAGRKDSAEIHAPNPATIATPMSRLPMVYAMTRRRCLSRRFADGMRRMMPQPRVYVDVRFFSPSFIVARLCQRKQRRA